MHKYCLDCFVPAPLEEVFEFFNRPENLVKLMPNFMRFKLLTPGTLEMKEGAVFDYLVHVFGVPNRWTTYISSYKPPYEFTDIQLKGPNAYWHHTHRFIKQKKGTLVTDEIHYMLPFGPLGKLANTLVMSPIISALFKHRSRVINDTFGTSS